MISCPARTSIQFISGAFPGRLIANVDGMRLERLGRAIGVTPHRQQAYVAVGEDEEGFRRGERMSYCTRFRSTCSLAQVSSRFRLRSGAGMDRMRLDPADRSGLMPKLHSIQRVDGYRGALLGACGIRGRAPDSMPWFASAAVRRPQAGTGRRSFRRARRWMCCCDSRLSCSGGAKEAGVVVEAVAAGAMDD